MFDAEISECETSPSTASPLGNVSVTPTLSKSYVVTKRLMDFSAGLGLIPLTLCVALMLLVLNPFLNKGSLLYKQVRMGQNGKAFTAFKFRTMEAIPTITRGAFDALEEDRITRLGAFLRKSRIDELPQIINLLKGEMGLIGPRPDFIDHAKIYVEEIPGYAERYKVRPGITGLAQTDVGYVSDETGIQKKVAADLRYIRTMGFRTDLKIICKTIKVMCLGHGK